MTLTGFNTEETNIKVTYLDWILKKHWVFFERSFTFAVSDTQWLAKLATKDLTSIADYFSLYSFLQLQFLSKSLRSLLLRPRTNWKVIDMEEVNFILCLRIIRNVQKYYH